MTIFARISAQMLLAYTLTNNEVLAGCRRRSTRLRAQTPIPGWVRAMSWLAVLLLLFAIFQLWDTLDRAGSLIAGDLILFLILLAVGTVSARAYWHIAMKQLFRHLAKEIHSATGEQRLDIEADSIALSTATSNSKFDRSLIEAVAADRKTQLLHIFLKGGSSIVVPRRAFASDAEQHDLIARLQPRTGDPP